MIMRPSYSDLLESGVVVPYAPTHSWRSNSTASAPPGDIEALKAARATQAQCCSDAFSIEGWFAFHELPTATYPIAYLASVYFQGGRAWPSTVQDESVWGLWLRYLGGSLYLNMLWRPQAGGSANQCRWLYTPTVDTFQHIAVTHDGATIDPDLYVNTVDQGAPTIAVDNGSYTVLDAVTTESFQLNRIDSDSDSYASSPLDTSYAHVRYWADKRTGTEIADNWKTNAPAGDNLERNYTLDNVLTDEQGSPPMVSSGGDGAFAANPPWS